MEDYRSTKMPHLDLHIHTLGNKKVERAALREIAKVRHSFDLVFHT